MKPIQVADLIALWESGIPAKKMWFSRKLNLCEQSMIDQVREALRQKGLVLARYGHKYKVESMNLPVPAVNIHPASNSKTVRWTPEEWDKLAEAVWERRQHEPLESFIALANKSQIVFPENRRRKLMTLVSCEPLRVRLMDKFRRMVAAANEAEQAKATASSLREQIAQMESKFSSVKVPTREEILDGLTEEEITTYFGDSVIKNLTPAEIVAKFPHEDILDCIPAPELAGYAFRNFMEILMDRQQQQPMPTLPQPTLPQQTRPNQPIKTQINLPTKKLPKVLIVGGTLGNEKQLIEKRLADKANVSIIDRKTDLPDADYYVIRAKFACHPMHEAVKRKAPAGRYLIHRGGIGKLVEAVEEMVK